MGDDLKRDPFADVVIIHRNDDALDMTEAERDAFERAFWDPKLMKCLPGVKPARFHVRRMTGSEMMTLCATGTPSMDRHAAFLVACHAVDLPDGRTLRPTEDERPRGSGHARASWLDRVVDEVGATFVQYAGDCALHLARLPASKLAPLCSRAG